MKKYLLDWMTILVVSIISISLVSCGDDEEEKAPKKSAIVGYWEDSHSGGTYDSYSFYDDGMGMYCKWEETPDSPLGTASSDFAMVFSYTFSGESLTLDFGFGYVKNYRVQSISNEYLDMYFSNSNILCTKKQIYDRNTFPDYAMAIVGGWIINDTEKLKRYDIYFRADGTYESTTNGVTEYGTYQVDKSRVKFTSSTNGSLLNGRIFLITHIAHSSYGGGHIYLQTENNVEIKGIQKS